MSLPAADNTHSFSRAFVLLPHCCHLLYIHLLDSVWPSTRGLLHYGEEAHLHNSSLAIYNNNMPLTSITRWRAWCPVLQEHNFHQKSSVHQKPNLFISCYLHNCLKSLHIKLLSRLKYHVLYVIVNIIHFGSTVINSFHLWFLMMKDLRARRCV